MYIALSEYVAGDVVDLRRAAENKVEQAIKDKGINVGDVSLIRHLRYKVLDIKIEWTSHTSASVKAEVVRCNKDGSLWRKNNPPPAITVALHNLRRL